MLRRWVICVVGAVLAFTAITWTVSRFAPQEVRHEVTSDGPVVVLGIPGAQWSGLNATTRPGLESLLQVAATGSLLPRATTTPTCTADAWLSLGAGTGSKANCRLQTPRVTGSGNTAGAQVPGYGALAGRNDGTTLGLLADTAAQRKQCIGAVGPGGAVAAANSKGTVARYSATADPVALNACKITFVDVSGTLTGAGPKNVESALQAVFTHIPAEATVIITGLSDGTSSVAGARLLMMLGDGVPRGTLDSSATEQPGLVTAADVSAVLFDRIGGTKPEQVEGANLTVRPNDTAQAQVAPERAEVDAAIRRSFTMATGFLVVSAVLAVLVLLLGALSWRRSGRPGAWLRPATVAVAAIPAASWLANIIPWWAGGPTTLWFALTTTVFVALMTAVAFAGPWREWSAGPALAIAALTATVLAVDVATGSRLQLLAPQGFQVLLGGRFHGMGNAAFGFFATAALLVGGLIAARLVWWDDTDEQDEKLAVATVIATVAGAVIIDAAPFWGADLGGPPALLLAAVVIVVVMRTMRVRVRTVALAVLAIFVVAAAAALADHARGPQAQTHLGRFVDQIGDGSAFGVVTDKLGANLALLFSSPLTLLVPIGVGLAWYLVIVTDRGPGARLSWLWDEVPYLRAVCLGILTCWSVAFLLNDSGVGVPATGAQIAIPLLVSVAAATWRERAPQE
ncbi:hypothetical protein ACMYYO_01285 [Dermacoccaceae bacterium W4C1]